MVAMGEQTRRVARLGRGLFVFLASRGEAPPRAARAARVWVSLVRREAGEGVGWNTTLVAPDLAKGMNHL